MTDDVPLLIEALHGKATARIPFWLMRQAGRYLPEYRKIRQEMGGFLELCLTPEAAAEVTLQPVRRFNTDAAILFSDILMIPYALGQDLRFAEGEGPILGTLPQTLKYDDTRLAPVYDTVRRVRATLSRDKALMGFSGAPWTLACYMLQGHGDGEFARAKTFAWTEAEGSSTLIETLVAAISAYLMAQIQAGADAVQLFDSWAGLLPEPLFKIWVIEPTAEIVRRVRARYPNIPIIGFPRGAGALYLRYAAETGVQAVGLDTQVPLKWACDQFGAGRCLQGNLDPLALLAGGKALENETIRILKTVQNQPFIFNLGHGIMKDTPPAHVNFLADQIPAFQREVLE